MSTFARSAYKSRHKVSIHFARESIGVAHGRPNMHRLSISLLKYRANERVAGDKHRGELCMAH